jgi:hypothetical protein
MVGAADGGGRWMVGLVARLLGAFVLSLFGSQKLVIVGAKISKEDLIFLGELMVRLGRNKPDYDPAPVGCLFCLRSILLTGQSILSGLHPQQEID